MPESKLTVADDVVVGLDYTLRLDDDEIVDSSDGDQPLEYLQGHGQIVPGLERALAGLGVGDVLDVTVAPTDAYGEVDPDAFEEVPLDAFPADVTVEPGMQFEVSDASGDAYDAYISEVRDDSVVLDLNHPLAGETLHFNVKVVSLRPATAEELEHGHVHGDAHRH